MHSTHFTGVCNIKKIYFMKEGVCMFSVVKEKLKNKKARVAASVPMLSAVMAIPAWASSGGSTSAGITSMLELFTQVAAWLWKEIGLFCNFVFGQPLLMLAFAIPFIGIIVNFFVRIFKTA